MRVRPDELLRLDLARIRAGQVRSPHPRAESLTSVDDSRLMVSDHDSVDTASGGLTSPIDFTMIAERYVLHAV